jgi:hypothetical protein
VLGDNIAEREEPREKKDKQPAKPWTNIFEDVTAAQYFHQVIVSTTRDLISATRATSEIGAMG